MNRVLIADDESMSRFLLEEAVNQWGYEANAVEDGQSAWDVLCAADPPRIAILDWVMPELDGLELCRRIKQRDDDAFTYVILLTGRNDTGDVIAGLDAGADDYLSKPFDAQELKSRLAVGARTVESEMRARRYGEQMRDLAQEREIFLQAFTQSIQSIFITNPEGDILHSNAAFRSSYGFAEEDLNGMNYSALNPSPSVYRDRGMSEEQIVALFRELHQSLNDADRGHWRGNLLHQTKSGDLRSIELFISAIRAADGEPIAHIAMPVDLTERTEQEKRIRLECYHAIADLAEKRDNETGLHLKRVSEYSALIAEQLDLPSSFVSDMRTFSPLHDIGKVGIPDDILLAPRKLTADEFDTIKTHATIGYEILKDRPTLEMAAEIAYTHHEKYDGSGYPRGIAGDAIPFCGRILALVDVYDALRTRRPYKEPWPHERAVSLIESERGKHFDPIVVDAFMDIAETFERISVSFQDTPAPSG